VAQEKGECEGEGEDCCDEEVTAQIAADKKGWIYAEGFYKEASGGVQAHVEQQDIAVLEAVREAAGDEEEGEADEQVPERLVEKRWVEGFGVAKAWRPVLGGYLYGPGEV
jgi:hypothetical protein